MGDRMDDTDRAVLTHTVAAVGRTGARGIEIGHLEDGDVPIDQARWYATAQYRGAKVSCDEQTSPIAAVVGLYAMLAAGGTCVTCRRTVAIDHTDQGYTDGARMRHGRFQVHRISRPPAAYCIRRYDPTVGWTRCETGGR